MVRQQGAPEEEAGAGRGQDVVTALRQVHGEVLALLRELDAIPGLPAGGSAADVARRIAIVDVLVAKLSAHEAAEEELFWPAVADAVDGGPSIVQVARSQEQESKAVLAALRREERKGAHTFEAQVVRLASLLREHLAFEESVFERVVVQVDVPSRRSLGNRVARATRRGPTRPHPHAPSGAAALHVVGPLSAVLDRGWDKVVHRPAQDVDLVVVERARRIGAQLPPSVPPARGRRDDARAGETASDRPGQVAPAAMPVDRDPRPRLQAPRGIADHVLGGGLGGGRGLARVARVGAAAAVALCVVVLVRELGRAARRSRRPPVHTTGPHLECTWR